MQSLQFSGSSPLTLSLSPWEHKPFSSITFGSLGIKRNQTNVLISMSLSKFRNALANNTTPSNVSSQKRLATGSGDQLLPEGLRPELMPNHVAVIMDGNRRWAQQRGLPVGHGHRSGGQRMRELYQLCCKWGVKVLTIYAFSSQNWARPQISVVIKSELEGWVRSGVKVLAIGDKSKFPRSLQMLLAGAIEATKANSRFQFIMALNYGGQYDIKQACTAIAHKVKDGLLLPQHVNEGLIEQELEKPTVLITPTLICSYEPAANRGLATSCCGNLPTLNCFSQRYSFLTLEKLHLWRL